MKQLEVIIFALCVFVVTILILKELVDFALVNRKSKKAMLMNDALATGATGIKAEQYAYGNEEYIELLQGFALKLEESRQKYEDLQQVKAREFARAERIATQNFESDERLTKRDFERANRDRRARFTLRKNVNWH